MSERWTWRVQVRVPDGAFDWITRVDKLNRDTADAEAHWLSGIVNPTWEIRLLNDAPGEIVHVEKVSAA